MIAGFFGDIVGSVYEGRQWISKDFDLFQNLPLDENKNPYILNNTKFLRDEYNWTDDTLCTLALYSAYINNKSPIDELVYYCKKYDHLSKGFGKAFYKWLDNPEPYNSFGNGSLMRIGFIPFINENLQTKLDIAHSYTAISHNHIDSFTSVKEFVLLTDKLKNFDLNIPDIIFNKKLILKDILDRFEFKKTVDLMHLEKVFHINAITTFLQAVEIIYESNSIDDVLKNTFYVGGDTDTLACIALNIAEFIWDFPMPYKNIVLSKFEKTPDLKALIYDFENIHKSVKI